MDEQELLDNGWNEPEDDYDPHDPFDPRNMTKDELEIYDKACWSGYAQYQAEEFFYESANRQMLEHATIANAWALPILEDENPTITWEKYMDLTGDYADRICKAVFSGKINGIMAWKSWSHDKWSNVRAQTSQESIARVLLDKKIAQTYQDNFDICLEIFMDRNDFSEWLAKEPDAKEIAGCVLNLWLENKYLDSNDQAVLAVDSKKIDVKRMKMLKKWYSDLCCTHGNNREIINDYIQRRTNKQIVHELINIAPQVEKHLWTVNNAIRWITNNGSSVWGFDKTRGCKPKKPG